MAIWYGKYGAVTIGTAITPGTSSNLYAQVTGSGTVVLTARVKDLSINTGEAGADVLNVFGTQLLEESRPEVVTADFTMVMDNIDTFASLLTWSTVAASSGYTRVQGGDYTGARTRRALGFQVAQTGVGTMNVLMNNALITDQGELSLAADGSGEQTFGAACLISDFYIEDNF